MSTISATPDSRIDEIFSLFLEKGGGAYFGESVTELEHALQCAHLAEQASAPGAWVAAALLHDIGHLLHDLGEQVADQGIDARHEDAGARWLERLFPNEVVAPVRLHVDAKRYLCAVVPGYAQGLSPASRQSLQLQGGPFDASEVSMFEAEAGWEGAVALRRWDDEAKVLGLAVPGLEHYRGLLTSLLLVAAWSGPESLGSDYAK